MSRLFMRKRERENSSTNLQDRKKHQIIYIALVDLIVFSAHVSNHNKRLLL